MTHHMKNRDIQYAVEAGYLVQIVQGEQEHGYVHRCSRDVYQQVAHHIDELPADGPGASQETIVRELGLPNTQVNVALEFMKERGCVVVRRHRSFPASRCTFEDAMVEFHFLAEEVRRIQ